MYIASTSTVLGYIPVAKVDLAAPVSQVMQAGLAPQVLAGPLRRSRLST
jgi:hypothetical protein